MATTCTPRLFANCTVAEPTPPDAPVTSAFFPLKSNMPQHATKRGLVRLREAVAGLVLLPHRWRLGLMTVLQHA